MGSWWGPCWTATDDWAGHHGVAGITVELATGWLERFGLGRGRILDTSLAAVYHLAGVRRLATANRADFEVFGVFSFEDWAAPPGPA